MNASNRTRTVDRPREPSEKKNGRGSALQKATCRTRELLADHPAASALTGFLLGFGVGLLMTACVGSSRRQESFTSRWGHKMHDAVAGVLPQSWSR